MKNTKKNFGNSERVELGKKNGPQSVKRGKGGRGEAGMGEKSRQGRVKTETERQMTEEKNRIALEPHIGGQLGGEYPQGPDTSTW